MDYLAKAFAYGLGRERDFKAALAWLRKAREANDPRSADYLGEMYMLGWGVAQDFVMARSYFELADRLGYIPAKRSLAWMYLDGIGVPVDAERGFGLLSAAAQQGHERATTDITFLYTKGIGTEKNASRAVAMLDDLVRKGSADGMRTLARYYLRDGDKTQRKTALDLLEKAVALGDGNAMRTLADVYVAGRETKRDFAKAESLLDQAIAQDILAAYRSKALLLLKMPDPRYDQAMYWMKEAASRGNARAMADVGAMYEQGKGVPVDESEARIWYGKSAELGDSSGARRFGQSLYMGTGGLVTSKTA
ncbi:tetratricopeptide repeat protein [Rhizobium leguminosarum]